MVIAHRCLVEPVQDAVSLLAPQHEIASEADALAGDIGAGLFKPERKPPEFMREFPRLRLVVGRQRPFATRTLQKELDGGAVLKHVKFERR